MLNAETVKRITPAHAKLTKGSFDRSAVGFLFRAAVIASNTQKPENAERANDDLSIIGQMLRLWLRTIACWYQPQDVQGVGITMGWNSACRKALSASRLARAFASSWPVNTLESAVDSPRMYFSIW